jgi:hypothetical protein
MDYGYPAGTIKGIQTGTLVPNGILRRLNEP